MTDITPQAEAPALAVVPTQQPAASPSPVDPTTPASPQAAPETEAPTDSAQTEENRDPSTGRFTKATERIQRQISDLTAQKHAARREVEQLRQQADALRNQYQAASKVDPNDYEANEMARTQKAVIGVQFNLAQQQAEQATQRANEARNAAFHAKVHSARERIPDIDQALQTFGSIPLSDTACDVIAESDKAAEIANFLGRNPDEAQRIVRLSPAYQAVEIARIESRVAAQPMKRISQAPAPVQIVSGGPSNVGVDLGTLSFADYEKARMGGAGR
jgi:hypothetical protein